jgi:hypothetical protein
MESKAIVHRDAATGGKEISQFAPRLACPNAKAEVMTGIIILRRKTERQ